MFRLCCPQSQPFKPIVSGCFGQLYSSPNIVNLVAEPPSRCNEVLIVSKRFQSPPNLQLPEMVTLEIRAMRITDLFLTALLLTAASTGTSRAELSLAGEGASIELSESGPSSNQQLVRALDETHQSGLSESVLRQHARSALRSQTPMGGNYGHEGAEVALIVNDHDSATFNARYPAYHTASMVTTSLAAAAGGAHFVGSGEVVGGSAPIVAASNGSSVVASSTTLSSPTATPLPSGQQNVPLPPTAILFASALFGLPVVTRRLGVFRQ